MKYGLTIFTMLILLSVSASATTVTTFTNNLNAENLTYTASGDFTRYLEIERYANVTNGELNFTGYQGTNYSAFINFYTTVSCGFAAACTNAYDNSTTTAGFYDPCVSGDAYSYENYTIPSGLNLTSGLNVYQTRWDLGTTQDYINTDCLNGSDYFETRIRWWCNGINRLARAECKRDNGAWRTIFDENRLTSPVVNMYYSYTVFRVNYPTSTYLEIGDYDAGNEWNYSSSLTTTTGTQFKDELNNILLNGCSCTGCTASEKLCTIDYTFHSSTIGILEYSYLDVTYDYYFNVSIYDEKDGSAFDIAGHNETKLITYCENETYETVLTQASTLVTTECNPDFFQLIVKKDTSTYYRTLYFFTDNAVDFYMADLNTDSVLEIILNINDLTNEYSEGYVILEKSINDSVVTIADQQINVENKATFFLLQNYHYTLKIKNNDGTIRSYGLFYATAAGEKSITLPEISIITSSILGDNVFYHWERTDTAIKLYYNDTETGTSILNLSIYNTTDNSLFYSTGDLNLGYAIYTVPVSNATTWYACLNATHETEGDLYNCRYFNAYRTTETDKSRAKLKYWAAVGFVFGICLAATRRFASGILATSTVLFWVFTKLGWVSFGAWGNGIVIAFGSLFAALSMFWEGENT